ncbi:MAG: DUF2007 domain-containing protein [Candidatus Sumerlaeia bacterium]|nr:DUF2007 domain-containing protein [Candidatus Sumerlaeia bacterium]
MSNDPIVTIATFMNHAHAQIARIALEGEDIPCNLADTNQGAYILGMLIGIRLQVFEEDADRARKVLQDAGVYQCEPIDEDDPQGKEGE